MTRNLAWKRLPSNKVLLSVGTMYVGVILRHSWVMLQQETLIQQHVFLGHCFVRRGFRWKLIHDPTFESPRNRANCGLDILAESDEDEFVAGIPRDPKNVTLIT